MVLVVNIHLIFLFEKKGIFVYYIYLETFISPRIWISQLSLKKFLFPLEVLEILIFIIATPYNLHPSVYQLYFIVHSRARCDHTCKINQDLLKSGLPGFEPAPCLLVDDSGFQVFILRGSSFAAEIIHSVPMLWAECWAGILGFRN